MLILQHIFGKMKQQIIEKKGDGEENEKESTKQ